MSGSNGNTRYVYPGTRTEFYREFGGVPDKTVKTGNLFLVILIIIIVIVIILIIALILSRTFITYTTNTTTLNLDNLLDLNKSVVKCCVFSGTTAPNELYVYDTSSNITYSRDLPLDINTVCNSFSNKAACVAQNTDANGKIIPVATFNASPYYTFESGLFNRCASTTTCA